MELQVKIARFAAAVALAIPVVASAQFAFVDGHWQTDGRSPAGFPTRYADYSDPSSLSVSSGSFSDGAFISSSAELTALQGSLGAKAYANFAAPAVPTGANVGMSSQSGFGDQLQVLSSTLRAGAPAVIRVSINFGAMVISNNPPSTQGFAKAMYFFNALTGMAPPLRRN